MSSEKMLELLLLDNILTSYTKDEEYADFIRKTYDIKTMNNRYITLGKEFLSKYARTKEEKS